MRLICRPFVLALVLLFSLSADAQLNKTPISKTTTQLGGLVTITAPTTNATPGSSFNITLTASNTTGQGITGFDLTLLFDPAVIQYNGCTSSGTIFSGTSPFCNLFPGPNEIDVSMSAITPVSGAGPFIVFNFTAIGSVGNVSPLNFTFFQWNEGDPAHTPVNGSVTLAFPPTSANTSVSGRVLTADGTAIRNARVIFTDADGAARSAVSNPFGYFTVEGLPAGQTYVVSTWAKGYNFEPVTLSVVEDITGFEIVAME